MKMLVSGALVLLVAFWTAYGAEAWTRRTLRGQLARYPVPMLLTGLPVDLGPVAPILRQDSDSFLLIITGEADAAALGRCENSTESVQFMRQPGAVQLGRFKTE